jgi:hypothetical protein
VPGAAAFIDELVSELETWPGVNIDRPSVESFVVSYGTLELGVLDRARGVAELHFSSAERDSLVEHGEAAPAEPIHHRENVSHEVRGPSDITAVLELFDRRYRDVRGEDDPYSSRDPD